MTSDIYQAYCGGGAGEFFRHHFADASARANVVRRAFRPLHPSVADAIERQNRRFAPSAARDDNLRHLRSGAAAVVTGQQVGLFLGPLYNFYKAASAIRAAREMAQASGAPVVPVFWLQTEDHDLPEIAACHVPRADGRSLRLELPASPADRVSLAHLLLPDAVEDRLDRLRQELTSLPHAEAHLARMARHYRAGARWCDAFAGMLAEIFGGQGLILIDPRVAELGPIAATVHRTAIEGAEPFAAALLERGRAIEAARLGEPMVHVREGAPLSFFHPQGEAGPRYRLEPTGGSWREVGGSGTHSTRALLEALENDPLSFSTSVLLRPILQDTLLPTAAYVGGPGEISYFAQLAPLYDAYGMTMPMIVPRASFRLIEGKTERLLERLGAQPSCAALGEEEILALAIGGQSSSQAEEIQRHLIDSFAAALQQKGDQLTAAGPGMTNAIDKARRSVEHAVARLVAKYQSAQLHQRQDLVDAARQMKQLLYPNGMPQERFFGLSYYAARYGEDQIIESILAAVEPFDPTARNLHCRESG